MLSPEITPARDIMVESFGRIYALYGMNEVAGRIYGLLYFSDEPLGLEEMARELKVSKATVSNNVRFLEGLKTVRKVWQKGSRRDYYVAARDVAGVLTEQLNTSMQKEMEISREAMAKSRAILRTLKKANQQESPAAASFDQHLDSLEKDYAWIYSFIQDLINYRRSREQDNPQQ
jgi:DNA-binding transcriptional regulator GbsR (MarR family)